MSKNLLKENYNDKVRIHICISGKVQNVFYRDFVKRHAIALNVTGWVKNLPDGKVEIIAEGEKEKVKQMVDWVKQGPPAAQVSNIDIERKEYKGEFKEFFIVY